MKIIVGFLLMGLFSAKTAYCQDTTGKAKADTNDISRLLEAQLRSEEKDKTEYVTATFKTTRLIDGHSIENAAAGVLDLKISHRFGPFSSGPSEFYGFDNARMRLGFDYGITNRLMVGVGRSSDLKIYDAFFKFKLLRQSTGKHKMPFTLSYIPMIAYESRRDSILDIHFSNRTTFTHQVIIGRKFSDKLSLQLMPTFVHRNLIQDGGPNDVYAIGIGGRQKLTKRTSFNFEYYYQLPGNRVPGSKNELSLGFDIETGGHVFQVHITNSMSMTESTFITGNKGPAAAYPNGDMRFGFNISRVFTLVHRKH